jgi:large subunit ribosomal protein L12
MEYVYAAMLLHSAKQEISESSLEKVLHSAGAKADSTKLKAMVAALKDVNIEEAIKSAALPTAAAPAAGAPAAEAKAEKKEDTAKSEEAAAEGLGALFG